MLSTLQEKLAEAHGLAIAADAVTAKVLERVLDAPLRHRLHELAREAGETRARCLEVERTFDDETATELLHHVDTTKNTATDLAGAWFKAGTSPHRAWVFLCMGEAAEVATWSAIAALAVDAMDGPVADLAAWALPMQQRHLSVALEGAVRLAADADASAARWG